MLFNLPHLAGYDDKERPWWPLADYEKSSLATPTARWLEQLAPTQQEWINKFGAPAALALTFGALVSWRMEMTRAMLSELRVQRETEARRAGLSRSITGSPHLVRGSPNGNAPESRTRARETVVHDAEDNPPDGHESIQDAFGTR